MDFKSKFYTIFKSLNPYNYSELAEHKFSQVLKYFLFIMIFSLIIMFIIFIPFLFYAGTYVSEGVGHFDTLNVSSTFQLKDSFNLLSDPVIRFEAENKNATNELVLITPDFVTYKRYLVFGPQREIPLAHGVDIAGSAKARMLISIGIFFILPSLFFWSIVFSIFYFSVIVLFTYILVLLINGLFHMDIGLLKLLKSCIYASTIFIMLQLILMPFFRMFLLPLAAYWLLVLIILFLWHEEHKMDHNQEHQGNVFSNSKSKDIFARSSSGSGSIGSSNKVDVRDSYDVDEHGNMKSASKRHRSVDEENEGYVELK
jgi:hypothetical protein